jgi:hypothetical protein
MPNHCDADMTVIGPSETLGEFLCKYVTLCDGAVLDLNAIRPYPAKYKEMDRIAREYEEQHPENPYKGSPKDGFNSGGYEWRIENWGTKWGCYQTYGSDTPIEKIDSGVILHFSTAWSPFNVELLQEVSLRFPSLEFTYDYYEQGAAFQGTYRVQAGSILSMERKESYDGDRGG